MANAIKREMRRRSAIEAVLTDGLTLLRCCNGELPSMPIPTYERSTYSEPYRQPSCTAGKGTIFARIPQVHITAYGLLNSHGAVGTA